MTTIYAQYDDFDPELSLPLYGWVTTLQDGEVPAWVREPTVNETEVGKLLAIPHGEDVDPENLPAGVKHEQVGGVQDRYRIEPEVYLRLFRSYANRTNREGPHLARFSLRMEDKTRLGSVGPQKTVPEKIKQKLQAITETPTWNDVVDDNPDVSFDGWMLTYTIGSRGGIKGVSITAKLHSSGAIYFPTPTQG